MVEKIISNTSPKNSPRLCNIWFDFLPPMCYNKYINIRRQKAFYCLTVSAASEAVYFFLLFSTLCNRKQKKGIRGITISLPMLSLYLKARAISKKYGVSPQHKPARKAHPANALNFISRRNCCSCGFASLSIMKVIAVSLVCCTGRSAALCAAPSIKPLLYEEKLLFIFKIPFCCSFKVCYVTDNTQSARNGKTISQSLITASVAL